MPSLWDGKAALRADDHCRSPAVLPFTDIGAAIGRRVLSTAVWLVVTPFAAIFLAIGVRQYSLAMPFVHQPFSNIHGAVGIPLRSLALPCVIVPLTLVPLAIRGGHDPHPMAFAV